jgi:hypothetical protein
MPLIAARIFPGEENRRNCGSPYATIPAEPAMRIEKTKSKFVVYALIAAALAAAFSFVYLGRIRGDMSDFGVPYRNALRIMTGETLYRVEDGHLQFKYAPVSALFYVPLALLPFETAKVVWYCLELVLLFAIFWLSYRLLPDKKKGRWFVLGFSLLVMLKFIGREMELGQVNILIVFILTLMLAAIIKSRDVQAGVLWALSLFFKPYALVFLPYFILKKRFKIVAAGTAALAAGLAVPALFYGVQGNFEVLKEWIATLSLSTPGLMAVGDNASLLAFLRKVLPGSLAHFDRILWFAFGAAAAGAFLWMMGKAKKNRIRSPEILEAAFLMILIPLLSPLGWYYNYLYALLAVVVIMNNVSTLSRGWKYVCAVDLIMIGGTLQEVLGRTLFRFYTRHSLIVVNFLVLLVVLAYLRTKKSA